MNNLLASTVTKLCCLVPTQACPEHTDCAICGAERRSGSHCTTNPWLQLFLSSADNDDDAKYIDHQCVYNVPECAPLYFWAVRGIVFTAALLRAPFATTQGEREFS